MYNVLVGKIFGCIGELFVLLFIGVIIATLLAFTGVEPLSTYKDTAINAMSEWWHSQGDTDAGTYAVMFNELRQEEGLLPLIFTDDLNEVAALRLEEIKVEFSHHSAGGYGRHLAENIVEGISNNQEALSCWEGSFGHRLNMLNSSYVYTGYAAGDGHAVQVFSSYKTVNGEPQLPPGWHYSD